MSSTESKEGLSKQLITSIKNITRLEQEKEHWLLEAQLMEIKYDKEVQVGLLVMSVIHVIISQLNITSNQIISMSNI